MTKDNINNHIYGTLNTETLFKEVKKIKNDTLKQIGNIFEYNLTLAALMISLPEIICSIESARISGLIAGYKAGLHSNKALSQTAIEKEARKFAESRTEDIIKKATTDGKERFDELIGEPLIYEPYMSILYAGVVFTWCSFEVFMKDLWEAALNTGNKLVTKTTLQNVNNVDKINTSIGIQGKYVNLDYLAQYNYNIANKLGSILLSKFDFSSVYGIKDAYSCAFPKSLTIKEALENKELVQLEARRHVIVHKAGIIDEAFCKKTDTSKKLIGNKLELSSKELSDFGNITIDVAIKVIKAVEAILSGSKVNN